MFLIFPLSSSFTIACKGVLLRLIVNKHASLSQRFLNSSLKMRAGTSLLPTIKNFTSAWIPLLKYGEFSKFWLGIKGLISFN